MICLYNRCIVERLPELSMERILEDSELLLQTILDWGRNSQNRLVFIERRDKYTLFRNPQNFLLTSIDTDGDTNLAASSKDVLLQEFFKKDQTSLPTTEGHLWLQEGRKKWVKHYFSLRASGIYYTPKGKLKSGDMVCLASLEHVKVYRCVAFKRKFSAPTDHVFSVKHPKVQTFKSKHVYCFCAETPRLKEMWIQMIRMGKYGYNMYEDYITTQQQLEYLLLPTAKTDAMRTKKRSTDQSSGERVLGKKNVLGEIFSSAWSKGDARIQRSKNMGGQSSSNDSCSSDESL